MSTESEQIEIIVKKLMAIKMTTKYGMVEIYKDFIDLIAYSLSIGSCSIEYDMREKYYNTILRKYTDEQIHEISLCIFDLGLLVNSSKNDVLGKVTAKLGKFDSALSQVMTPSHISCLMAELSSVGLGSTYKEEVTKDGYTSVVDICSGTGSLLLGSFKTHISKGLAPNTLLVMATDIDDMMVKMCYIQLAMAGASAIVKQVDAMGPDGLNTVGNHSVWYTPLYLKSQQLYAPKKRKFKAKVKKKAHGSDVDNGEQEA